MAELSVQDRAILALARHAFPGVAIFHLHRRAQEMAPGDGEVQEYLRSILQIAELMEPRPGSR